MKTVGVKVGQVWNSKDARRAAELTIIEVNSACAYARSVRDGKVRKVSIRLDRFRNKYRLIGGGV